MIGYIYKITNTINGKVYIGQTIRDVYQRFKEHFYPSSKCKYLNNSIKKYGKNVFVLTILERIELENKNIVIEKLNELEIKYINENNSLIPNGYNTLAGGANSVGRIWGKKMSPEAVFARSKKCWKSIICNETQEVWPSIKACALSFNVNTGSIYRVLSGKRKHFRKMTFSYYNSKPIKFSEKSKENIRKSVKGKIKKAGKPLTQEQINRMKTPIICNETGVLYSSLTEAAKLLNLSISKISLVLSGKRNHHKGLTFSLYEPILGSSHKEVK